MSAALLLAFHTNIDPLYKCGLPWLVNETWTRPEAVLVQKVIIGRFSSLFRITTHSFMRRLELPQHFIDAIIYTWTFPAKL